MDNIIQEKLKKADIVVDEKERTIEVYLDVGVDGEPFVSNNSQKKISNPNCRNWREGNIRKHLKHSGYKCGECIEGLKSVVSNTVGNNKGYWKYKLRTVKNVEITKQDIKNENTSTKTKKPRRRKTKAKE